VTEPPADPLRAVQPSPEDVFVEHARLVLSARWGTALDQRVAALPGGVSQRFRLVSGNGRLVGEALWLGDLGPPEHRSATISEAVWVAAHVVNVDRRFLVLGQERDLVGRWLDRHAPMLDGVELWFLEGDRLERLA
jgi:hypothetical protein